MRLTALSIIALAALLVGHTGAIVLRSNIMGAVHYFDDDAFKAKSERASEMSNVRRQSAAATGTARHRGLHHDDQTGKGMSATSSSPAVKGRVDESTEFHGNHIRGSCVLGIRCGTDTEVCRVIEDIDSRAYVKHGRCVKHEPARLVCSEPAWWLIGSKRGQMTGVYPRIYACSCPRDETDMHELNMPSIV